MTYLVDKLPDRTGPDGVVAWVVYHSPSDFPGVYVVRKQTVRDDDTYCEREPVAVGGTLTEVRAIIPTDLVRLERHPDDDPPIVETWL